MISAKLQLEPETAEIMQRAKEANAEAFYQLVRPCQRAIFQAALAILGNVADAEDVAQEAVLKAFKHISSFRGESKFSTWLIQITINEARMKLRKDRPGLYCSLDESTSNQKSVVPSSCPQVIEKNGERGRNRTFNLLIKSRPNSLRRFATFAVQSQSLTHNQARTEAF